MIDIQNTVDQRTADVEIPGNRCALDLTSRENKFITIKDKHSDVSRRNRYTRIINSGWKFIGGRSKMKILRFFLLFVCAAPLFPEKVAELPEVDHPAAMTIADSILYICDRESIHLFQLKPFHFVEKFGRRGEGPGEFNSPPHLVVYPNHLFINTMGKIMKFSKKGEFLEQSKIPFTYFYVYFPLMQTGPNYVGLPLKRVEDTVPFIHTVNIYDSQLKLIKEIYQGTSPQLLPPSRPGTKIIKQDYEVIPDCLEVAVEDNKIYVGDTRRGFFIAVFSNTGEHLFDIEKKYRKVKVPDEFKKEFWQEMRASERWEEQKQRYNYLIKDYYPAFYSMKIQQKKIYVTTYDQKNSFYELVVLDLQGNIVKRDFSFPLNPEFRVLTGTAPFSNQYAVSDDIIYYVVLNEDSMLYELHSSSIVQ